MEDVFVSALVYIQSSQDLTPLLTLKLCEVRKLLSNTINILLIAPAAARFQWNLVRIVARACCRMHFIILSIIENLDSNDFRRPTSLQNKSLTFHFKAMVLMPILFW